MENIFYVYEHYKPNCDEPFYVGKGCNQRAYSKHRNPWWKNIVNKHGFEVRFIAQNLTEKEAFWLENMCIVGWGRSDLNEGPLVNLTDGGDGSSGNIQSEQTKRRKSDTLKIRYTTIKHHTIGRKHSNKWKEDRHKNSLGEHNPFFGKFHNDKTIDVIRKSSKGRIPWNKGKKMTSEQTKNMKNKKGHGRRIIKEMYKLFLIESR